MNGSSNTYRMKVLYISMPPFLDVDLSLVNHLSDYCDVYYLMDLPPYYKNSSALRIDKLNTTNGIIKAAEYSELHKFSNFIALEKWSVINRISPKKYALRNLKLQSQITSFIDKLNPDIIHCANFLDGNFYYFLFKNKRKIVVTVHDPFPHSGESNFRKSSIRRINYKSIENIILLNAVQKDEFVKKTSGMFTSVFVSSLGIYEYLRIYKAQERESKTFKILFFGRISPYKGIDTLLCAFEGLLKKYDNIELTIAGNGKFWFDITPYRENPSINFINRYVPNEELVELLTSASVVVCPYKDATQSGVVMSAFALGKPVVGTRVGALPEMIEHNVTGVIVPPDDANALEEAIKELIESPALLAAMHTNIKNKYENGAKSWKDISFALYNHYLKLLSA